MEQNIEIKKCHCNRCGYDWYPRPETILKHGEPKICPICKSRHWNKPEDANRKPHIDIKPWDERSYEEP